jgi:hypothetical protein
MMLVGTAMGASFIPFLQNMPRDTRDGRQNDILDKWDSTQGSAI